eukprot:scaffold313960_cov30-Tisochrysis_lutea.AAC.1
MSLHCTSPWLFVQRYRSRAAVEREVGAPQTSKLEIPMRHRSIAREATTKHWSRSRGFRSTATVTVTHGSHARWGALRRSSDLTNCRRMGWRRRRAAHTTRGRASHQRSWASAEAAVIVRRRRSH